MINGLGLTAVVAHLTGWPHRRSRLGLPWLEDCEGLGPELMRFYNPILYVSGAACLVGLIRENRSVPASLPLLTLALRPVLVAAQHREFRQLTQEAAANPGWWNRRLSSLVRESQQWGEAQDDTATARRDCDPHAGPS
jgi:hypothetical protein